MHRPAKRVEGRRGALRTPARHIGHMGGSVPACMGMPAEDPPSPSPQPGTASRAAFPVSPQAGREVRLAAALRANLRRRKAQARARAADQPPAEPGDPPMPTKD